MSEPDPPSSDAGAAAPEPWPAAQVHALAPDAAALKAAQKLASPAGWSERGTRARLLWGDCKGSGSKPYQVTVELPAAAGAAPAYSCTCPSHKFPCKHALGLLLQWSGGTVPAVGEQPPRVVEWAEGRARRAEKAAARAEARQAAQDGEDAAEDEGGAQRTAKAAKDAERRAAQRTARIDAGLAELELWLADQVRLGLPGLKAAGSRRIDELARRLVDAQAPGAAGQVRRLVPALLAPDWPERTLTELAALRLLTQAWHNRDALPAPLAATVRRRIGLVQNSAQITETGERVTDRWLVLGVRDRAAEKLTERTVWLLGEESDRLAVLLAYASSGQAPALALPVGSVLVGELAFAREAVPLRAVVARQTALESTTASPVSGPASSPAPAGGAPTAAGNRCGDLVNAAAAFAAAYAADPWTASIPVLLESAVPTPAADDGDPAESWQIADTRTGTGVPLLSTDQDAASGAPAGPGAAPDRPLLALLAAGGRPARFFGLYQPAGFTPITVWNAQGPVSLV
ncbi:MAG TPA: SWIM zinc finger family protein [Actinocrinis sp.]